MTETESLTTMLSGIANLIWGNAEGGQDDVKVDPTTQPTNSDSVRLKVRDAEDDWELVDKLSEHNHVIRFKLLK